MARIARSVVPGYPHHITQRGNRRQETFFSDEDYRHYIDLMAEWCSCCGVAIWAYCLMPNHTHLIAVPPAEDSLRTGRPLGGQLFIDKLEELLRRQLRRGKPGPKGPWKHRNKE